MISKDAELKLWARYIESRDPSIRRDLIELYLPHVRMLAAMIYSRRQNNEIEFDDYHQLARIGLLEAVDRFDPSRGLQFSTFADLRIRGAILNGLENQTEKQRQISTAKRLQIERTSASKDAVFESLLNRDAAKNNVFSILAEVGLGLAISWILTDTGKDELEEDHTIDLPFYKNVELKQLSEQIKLQVKNLSLPEQRVIKYHYLQGISIDEIAEICSLSKGRISQIHRSALQNLKRNMKSNNLNDFIC